MASKCIVCGESNAEDARFCKKCGQRMPTENHESTDTENHQTTEMNDIAAPEEKGSMDFNQVMVLKAGVLKQESSLFRYLGGRIKSSVVGFRYLFKDPKLLITAVFIILVWIVQLILKAAGTDNIVTRIVGYVTYAKAGTTFTVRGFISGIAGRFLYISSVLSLVKGFASLGRPSGRKDNGKNIAGAFKVCGLHGLVALMLGCGLGIIGYTFLSNSFDPELSIIGGVSIAMLLRVMARGKGFLYGFFESIMTKSGKDGGQTYIKTYANPHVVMNTIAGVTIGTAIALPITLTESGLLGYGLGIIFLVIAFAAGTVAYGLGGGKR